MQKITDKGYQKLERLESWHGFWVKSRDEWALTLPSDQNPSDENITLYKGWNLISLPVDTVVSPHIFDGKTVWKYARADGWELFDKEKSDYPAIDHISSADGIWVKSDSEQTVSTVTDAAKLHNFPTTEVLENYVREMLLTHQRPWCGYYPLTALRTGVSIGGETVQMESPATPKADEDANSAGVSDASETNLQESGVDESDIIKHNGEAIFYPYHDLQQRRTVVGVTTFSAIVAGETRPLHVIVPEGSAADLYIYNNRLVVLSDYGNDLFKPIEPLPAEKPLLDHGGDIASAVVEIFDISDIDAISKLHTFRIEGNLHESRRIGNRLYLITQFHPLVTRTYPRIYVDAPECKDYFYDYALPVPAEESNHAVPVKPDRETLPNQKNGKKYARCYGLLIDESGRFYREDYDHPKITFEKLLPDYYRDGTDPRPLVTPQTFYASDRVDQEPLITTVSQIDLDAGAMEQTTSILGYADTVYASADALYIASDRYPLFNGFDRYEIRSALYRFAFGEGITYDAFGFVRGKPLNQFSLSEYNGYLRIATTEGNSWQGDEQRTLHPQTDRPPTDHTGRIERSGEKG